jgi:hypothetical protein
MIKKAQLDLWRKLKGEGMTSALGEYTPEEFWELLDAYEKLRLQFGELVHNVLRGVDAFEGPRELEQVALECEAEYLASLPKA